jgi:hypothetical protein
LKKGLTPENGDMKRIPIATVGTEKGGIECDMKPTVGDV